MSGEYVLQMCLYCRRPGVSAAEPTSDIPIDGAPTILFTSAMMCRDCAQIIKQTTPKALALLRSEMEKLQSQRMAVTAATDGSPRNSTREVEKFLRDLGFSF